MLSPARIQELRTMPYDQYLQSPEWQERREKALAWAERRCQVCYSGENLQVHHRTYERRGNERDSDLVALCKQCHERHHQVMNDDTHIVHSFSDAIDEYMLKLDQRRKDILLNDIRHGLSTGYTNLDRMTGGFSPGKLYTLGSLTGHGKSAFAENMALNIAFNSKHVMFVSLEMDKDELVQRALSFEAERDQSGLRDGYVDDLAYETLSIYARRFKREFDITIDDGSFTLDEIRDSIQQVHACKHIDLVIIDYLQLIEVTGTNKNINRAQEIADITRSLKLLARRLQLPILVLVQLKREFELRLDEGPKLSDISDSSGIAKDSDVVILLWANKDELLKRDAALPYQVTVTVAKNRNGRMGSDVLDFAPRITKFREPFLPGSEEPYE